MKRITANQYQTSERYYKLPKILFEDEKYMDMKLEVKLAYSILKIVQNYLSVVVGQMKKERFIQYFLILN